GSQNNAVPTETAASVAVPWWPAITLSTKPISPVERWPSTSGPARIPVRRTSVERRGDGRAAIAIASEAVGRGGMWGVARSAVQPLPQPVAQAAGLQRGQLAAQLGAVLRRAALDQHRQILALGRGHGTQRAQQRSVLRRGHL